MPGWGLISSTLSPRGWDPTGPPAWGVRQADCLVVYTLEQMRWGRPGSWAPPHLDTHMCEHTHPTHTCHLSSHAFPRVHVAALVHTGAPRTYRRPRSPARSTPWAPMCLESNTGTRSMPGQAPEPSQSPSSPTAGLPPIARRARRCHAPRKAPWPAEADVTAQTSSLPCALRPEGARCPHLVLQKGRPGPMLVPPAGPRAHSYACQQAEHVVIQSTCCSPGHARPRDPGTGLGM